jgi:hypothetical protein
MRQGRPSIAGLSLLFALGLALWEVYFFFAGSFPSLDGTLGPFAAERLGFNMAWLAAIYLTFQLISIPFALPSATSRFIGVVDGMFRKAALDRHRAALGGSLPAHLHHLGRPVRRIHVQYRAPQPHHGCHAGCAGLNRGAQ